MSHNYLAQYCERTGTMDSGFFWGWYLTPNCWSAAGLGCPKFGNYFRFHYRRWQFRLGLAPGLGSAPVLVPEVQALAQPWALEWVLA